MHKHKRLSGTSNLKEDMAWIIACTIIDNNEEGNYLDKRRMCQALF